MTDEERMIQTRLVVKQVYDALSEQLGSSLFGVFLYGSQNYNLDTDESDVDLVVVYVPDLIDAVFGDEERPNVSINLKKYDVESVTYRSLKDFIRSIVYKPSISSIEYMCGRYNLVNARYAELWRTYFTEKADDIILGNLDVFLSNIHGMATRYLHDSFEKDSPKYLVRYHHCQDVLERLAGGEWIHDGIIRCTEKDRNQYLWQQKQEYIELTEYDIGRLQESLNDVVYEIRCSSDLFPSMTEWCKKGLLKMLMRKKEQ